MFAELTEVGWDLIELYLKENQRHFGIGIDDLLRIDGVIRQPGEVYRKVTVKGRDTLLKLRIADAFLIAAPLDVVGTSFDKMQSGPAQLTGSCEGPY